MIRAVEYARTSGTPYLGICLGLQVATIEWCRNVLKMDGANSTEFEETAAFPVVVQMLEHDAKTKGAGGTMRLGSRRTLIRPKTLAAKVYSGAAWADERHRHRYEINPTYLEAIEKSGLLVSGRGDGTEIRAEIIEIDRPAHPFFMGVQFHPEYQSRPSHPSPPFLGFIKAALEFNHAGTEPVADIIFKPTPIADPKPPVQTSATTPMSVPTDSVSK